MTENKLELDIISLYDANVKTMFSINQISKKLNKTYPYINKKVNYLIQKDILQKVNFGRSHLCSLNLTNDKTIMLLALHEINKKQEFLDNNPHTKQLLDALKSHTRISCALTVGTNKLVIVCETEEQKQRAGQYARSAEIYTHDEFLNVLKKERSAYVEDRIILQGYERYFDCLMEVDDEITKLYSPLAL